VDTKTLLQLVATGKSDERTLALSALTVDNNHYSALLQSLTEVEDTSLNFWALDLLIKHFPHFLQRDSSRTIPLVIACLTRNSGPVCDRAIWALNIIGLPALEALVAATHDAPDTLASAYYMGAIKENANVYLLANQIINLLDKQLDSSNEYVRYWALVVLTDISPLRPWFDTRMSVKLFEPLYSKLLSVAQQLIANKHEEMAAQYERLLIQHLTPNGLYRP